MSTPTWIKDILRGGLPEVLDLGDTAPSGDESQDASGTRPEQSPPTHISGGDNANPAQNFLMSVTQNQILMATGFLVAGIALANFVRK